MTLSTQFFYFESFFLTTIMDDKVHWHYKKLNASLISLKDLYQWFQIHNQKKLNANFYFIAHTCKKSNVPYLNRPARYRRTATAEEGDTYDSMFIISASMSPWLVMLGISLFFKASFLINCFGGTVKRVLFRLWSTVDLHKLTEEERLGPCLQKR